MQPPSPYEVHRLPDGSLVFRPHFSLGTQLEWLASNRRRLKAATVVAVVIVFVSLLARPTTDDRSPRDTFIIAAAVILGLFTIVAVPMAWLAHRRLGELRFDVARRSIIQRVGPAIERTPFSRVEGVYCVRDQWTGVDDLDGAVDVYEVSLRAAGERILLARYATRDEAEWLRQLVAPVVVT